MSKTTQNACIQGGNAPFIVFGDADVDQAVDGALASRVRSSLQTLIIIVMIWLIDLQTPFFCSVAYFSTATVARRACVQTAL